MDGGRLMRQVLGRSFFLLIADLRRSGPRIGRGSFYCGVALFTRMGTSACFAAAGSARIEGAEITEDGLSLADVRSRPVATFAGGIFLIYGGR